MSDYDGDANKEKEIKCSQCRGKYVVHNPNVMRINSPGVSELLLFSTFNLDERKCPHCGAIHAPTVMDFTVAWIHYPKKGTRRPAISQPSPEEIKRITEQQLRNGGGL